MVPTKVLTFAKFMGASLRRVVVIGCEPEMLGEDEEGRMGLSLPVAAMLDEAVSMVEFLIDQQTWNFRCRKGKGEASENV